MDLKQKVAEAALAYIKEYRTLGIGTGRTAHAFMRALIPYRGQIDACVASSEATAAQLRAYGFPVVDLNAVDDLPLYIDGTDEVNAQGELIKGGGGASTREKIVASVAQTFLCLAEERKWVTTLGEHPIAVEVLPMARSFVARALVKLDLNPVYRQGVVTDNGHCILDVYGAKGRVSLSLEQAINQITGVVENGLFIQRRADLVLIATAQGEINVLRPNLALPQ